MPVSPIPERYPRLCPLIAVDDAAAAIAFYSRAFGAVERLRLPGPDDKIVHAELEVAGGAGLIMLSDEFPDWGVIGPTGIGGTPVMLSLYVEDVDSAFAVALEAGAIEQRPVADQFTGDRSGQLIDPFGHRWTIASRVEEVTPAQQRERWSQMS